MNVRSEPLNVRSEPLNVRSKPLNGDFIIEKKQFHNYPKTFYIVLKQLLVAVGGAESLEIQQEDKLSDKCHTIFLPHSSLCHTFAVIKHSKQQFTHKKANV